MIRFPPIPELNLVGVDKAGIPDEERIVLRPTQQVNLGYFGMLLGRRADEGVQPVQNFFFWFSEITVRPPSWVFVYTGRGEARWTTTRQTEEKALIQHWGLRHTVFSDEAVRPVLFRFGSINVGGHLPQKERRLGAGDG